MSTSLLQVLRQGLSPSRLALTVSLGFGIGCFPILGITTVLCALIALAFRLNLPAIQVGNFLALPLQLILVIPFIRLGERILHASPLPLAPDRLLAMMQHTPDATMRAILAAQWHALFAWLLVVPWMVAGLALLLRPLVSRMMALANSRRPALPS